MKPFLALALLLSGCHWLLPLAGTKGASEDGPAADSPAATDRSAADRPADAAWLPACVGDGDGVVVAAYLLDPGETVLLAPRPGGFPDGMVHGGATIGPGPCPGTAAIAFDGKQNKPPDGGPNDMGLEFYRYAAIPDHPAWHIRDGEVAFHVRLAETFKRVQGILSRDAVYAEKPGHLTVLRVDNRVVVRFQVGQVTGYACSDVVQTDTWYRVRVGFGETRGLSLEVKNHATGAKVAPFTGILTEAVNMVDYDCGEPGTAAGIDGNSNVWVLGVISWSGPEGGTVDQVVLNRPLIGSIAALVIRDRGH